MALMQWDRMVKQITKKDRKWTYETIGKHIGMSRSAVGRMVLEPVKAEPPFSCGMKLIELHEQVLEGKHA